MPKRLKKNLSFEDLAYSAKAEQPPAPKHWLVSFYPRCPSSVNELIFSYGPSFQCDLVRVVYQAAVWHRLKWRHRYRYGTFWWVIGWWRWSIYCRGGLPLYLINHCAGFALIFQDSNRRWWVNLLSLFDWWAWDNCRRRDWSWLLRRGVWLDNNATVIVMAGMVANGAGQIGLTTTGRTGNDDDVCFYHSLSG